MNSGKVAGATSFRTRSGCERATRDGRLQETGPWLSRWSRRCAFSSGQDPARAAASTAPWPTSPPTTSDMCGDEIAGEHKARAPRTAWIRPGARDRVPDCTTLAISSAINRRGVRRSLNCHRIGLGAGCREYWRRSEYPGHRAASAFDDAGRPFFLWLSYTLKIHPEQRIWATQARRSRRPGRRGPERQEGAEGQRAARSSSPITIAPYSSSSGIREGTGIERFFWPTRLLRNSRQRFRDPQSDLAARVDR